MPILYKLLLCAAALLSLVASFSFCRPWELRHGLMFRRQASGDVCLLGVVGR